MNKYSLKTILYPVFLSVAVVAGIFIGIFASRSAVGVTPLPVRTNSVSDNKLIQSLSLIERLYLDPVSIDSLTEALMPALLGELDPHSIYIPAEQFANANESLDGEFDGIGVVFNMSSDTIMVLNVIAGGPSAKAGIMNGDRIIKVNDTIVAGQNMDQNAVVRMLRGKRGTKVDLDVQRSGITSLVPITVTRDKIPVKSVTAAFMMDQQTAYLKLSSFSKNSHREIDTTLTRFREEGMTKLIFDLRGNTGGFLDQAIRIANDFLPSGKMIVYTEERNGNRTEDFSNGKGKFQDIELAILIDEGSASSSEILAGAIQDNDRGIILGRRSFGKGLVQQQIPFSDGSALRLTIAKYFTPTGRSIQKPYTDGAEGNRQYRDDFRNRYEHNELFTADSIKFNDSLRFITPGGKIVYGGGGIMPDIFVPLDTMGISDYFVEVSGKNIIYKYTIEYSDNHREQVNAVNSVAGLDAMLNSDHDLMENFIRYAEANGVRRDPDGIRESEDLIRAQIRALIGRNTPLEDTGFYSQIYHEDNVMQKALEVLDGDGRALAPGLSERAK